MTYYKIMDTRGIWRKIAKANSSGKCVMRIKNGECVKVCEEKKLVKISLRKILKSGGCQ